MYSIINKILFIQSIIYNQNLDWHDDRPENIDTMITRNEKHEQRTVRISRI